MPIYTEGFVHNLSYDRLIPWGANKDSQWFILL